MTDRIRTKAEVLAAREHSVMGGCCNRFADQQSCDCLEEASDGRPDLSVMVRDTTSRPSRGQVVGQLSRAGLLELASARREIARLQDALAASVRRYDEQERLFVQACDERNALVKERDRLAREVRRLKREREEGKS